MELRNFGTSELRKSGFVENPEELEVFKVAYEVSLQIHKLTLKFPDFEKYDLGNQMRKASRSICANICEGFYKQGDYPLEFKRFLSISIGSCGEMKLWLKYCLDLGYISQENFNELRDQYGKVKNMLGSLREKIKS